MIKLYQKIEQCILIFSSKDYFLIRKGRHGHLENEIMVSSNMTAETFNRILVDNKEEIDKAFKK